MCTTQMQVSEEINGKCQVPWSWVRNNFECPFVLWETNFCHLQEQQALLSFTVSEWFFGLFVCFKSHVCYGAGGFVCLVHGGSQKTTLEFHLHVGTRYAGLCGSVCPPVF